LTGLTPFASTVGCPAWLLAADAVLALALAADAVLALALAAGEAVELAPCPHAVSSAVPATTAMETRASWRLVTITLPL
jgi:hypothetical protein